MTNLREPSVAKKGDRFQEALTVLGAGSPNRRFRVRAHATVSKLARILTFCGFRKWGIEGRNIARNRLWKEGMGLLYVSFVTLTLSLPRPRSMLAL